MGDLTELIREKIEAKRKEVESRYQQNYKELNKKHREKSQSYNKIYEEIVKITKLISSLKEEEEEAAHEIVDSDGNDNTNDNDNNYDNESLSNIDVIDTTPNKNKNNDNNNSNNNNNINNNNKLDDIIINNIERPDQSINNSHKCDGNDGKDINDLTSKIVINSINHNDIGDEEDDENYVVEINSNLNAKRTNNHSSSSSSSSSSSPSLSSLPSSPFSTTIKLNDRRPSYNHLTNGKMEIIKANYKLKKLENKYKNIGESIIKIEEKKKKEREAYQRTFQEFDEFEQNLTAISDEFENNQKHALLNLVKGFNDNKVEDDHDEKDEKPQEITNNNDVERKNKRKIEKEVEGEVSTSKKAKYVAAGAGIAGLLSLAPWVLDNLPLLQQHLQNLPFI